MTSLRLRQLGLALILTGAVLVALVAGLLPGLQLAARWGLVAVSLGVAAGVFCIVRSGLKTDATTPDAELARQRAELDTMRAVLVADLESREQRVAEREQEVSARSLRFHEFLEYPTAGESEESRETRTTSALSAQDRQVRVLLEQEAARFYEKIRTNSYIQDGRLNPLLIRDDALDLMKRVAQVYKPDSEQPLLETSFDQLARAASRICLQTLVLLEQLPVQVQHYSLSTLYGYFRKAVIGYGVYQTAAPWLTTVSRGLYAGRLAATTNPLTLGTWWLASELGRYGTRKVVENVVDRQAIAILHELVSVVGTEIAGIYGTGFRRRDPAWILGTELVELIQSFPQSGESLRNGLQQVTALPLRSEYDRIYLYRCLAGHRSAGLHLSDPAVLTRDEREAIARQLEAFYAAHIHGSTETASRRWREGFERRFDLKLQVSSGPGPSADSRQQELEAAAVSLAQFVTGVAAVAPEQRPALLNSCQIVRLLPEAARETVIRSLAGDSGDIRFEPPAIDPSSGVLDTFLSDLAVCGTATERPEDIVEQFVVESFAYFRRPAKTAREALEKEWIRRAKEFCRSEQIADRLTGGMARTYFENRQEGERIACAYDGLGFVREDQVLSVPRAILLGLALPDGSRRLVVAQTEPPWRILWEGSVPARIVREKGLLIDDARVQQGRWISNVDPSLPIPPTADLVISGSLRGGRYSTWFRDLLEFAQS